PAQDAPAGAEKPAAEKPAEKASVPFTGNVGPVDVPAKPADGTPAEPAAPKAEPKPAEKPSQAVKNMIDLI
ncbi:MAG: hypothetical protein IJS32_10005, partial [Kiritimatiellae bacterium]|nr:hypothetical protein [Kiritimatiellia bacterium]